MQDGFRPHRILQVLLKIDRIAGFLRKFANIHQEQSTVRQLQIHTSINPLEMDLMFCRINDSSQLAEHVILDQEWCVGGYKCDLNPDGTYRRDKSRAAVDSAVVAEPERHIGLAFIGSLPN